MTALRIGFFFLLPLLPLVAFAQNDPPTEMALQQKDGIHNGLQIGRSELFKHLLTGDSTLSFKEQKPVEKLPVFIAQGIDNSSVEAIGTENNLRRVTYKVFIVKGNKEALHLAFDKIGHLIGSVVPRQESIQWLLKQYSSIYLFPLASIKESYSIIGNLITFTYDPGLSSIMLTVATEH